MPRKILGALCLVMCLALTGAWGAAQEVTGAAGDSANWLSFLMICNGGMRNDGGDASNMVMVISMNPDTGRVRQIMFAWDTFIEYAGYELPQKMDRPFRMGGPEETVRVFNQNFEQNIQTFLSINYLNVASLIDAYGGVAVDVTRAERNALNSLVAAKKDYAKSALGTLSLDENLFNALMDSYSLEEYGPDTQLSGMQAVAYGWLQYDSVYNCCVREVKVIAQMFGKMSRMIEQRAAFYMDGEEIPGEDGRRRINIDQMTDEDQAFLYEMISPIFERSYNNLTGEQVRDVVRTIARSANTAQRMGVELSDTIEYRVLPLESGDPYETVAGVEGHVIDGPANILAINHFLYGMDVSPLLDARPLDASDEVA